MADNDEFKMMGFRELEKYRKKEGRYHEQDPRHPDNSFDTDDDVKKAYRIKMGLQERKEIDAKKDTKGELEALPVVRDEEVKKVFEQIKKEEIKKGNRPKELKAAKGASISKQMELFEEGGLKEEGGMVDEVSGNDVPPGSTREEVRDDIPAQLSEGEFVFPADVVRYIGLEKLMRLRQEAKQGLKAMEAMGQMGNSDEAIMPDDLPFDETDLDIEDEEEYNNDTQEMNQGGMVRVGGIEMPRPIIAGQQMAEGGVVKAQSGTFVNPGTGVTTIPSQFAGQNLPSYRPNQTLPTTTRRSYTVPTIPGQTTGYRPTFYGQPPAGSKGVTTPTFETLVGRNPGQYDEMREYVNDAGSKLQIPFKNGQPIYPIPEGYKYIDPEKEETETAKTQTTQTGTTQVSGDGGDNTGARVGTTMVGKTGKSLAELNPQEVQKGFSTMSPSQRGLTVMDALDKAKGTTGLARGLQQLGTAITPGALAAGMIGQKTLDPRNVLSQVGIPDTKNLNSLLNAFGPSTVGLSPEEIDMQGIDRNEALSQAMYGMSYEAATRALGVAPSFTKGYKNGQVDPATGVTYAYGQATDDNGNVSYGSIDDFGIGVAAMSATGFMGGMKDAERVAEKGKTKEARQTAKDYMSFVKARTKQKEQDKKDKEAAERGGTGDLGGIGDLGSGYGIGASTGKGSQTVGTEDVDPTGGGKSKGPGATAGGATAAPGTGTDPGSPNSGEGGDTGPGGAGSSSDDGAGGVGPTAKGGFIPKINKKTKQMKRGGLASKK